MPTAEDSPKLTWPPTKEDLQRLYVEQRLSAAKIAKIYGRNTNNPRSGAFLILYYLKKHGFERRDRVEELRKETEAVMAAWKAKYPKKEGGERTGPAEEGGQEEEPIRLTTEEKAVIELLQHKNLSIRHLDFETKGRIRAAMEGLHWTRELSLNDIADIVGNKTSGYSSWLFGELGIEARPFEEARLKGVAKHLRIHERRPFDGSEEDKAYLLGIAHGDFHVSRPFGDAVRISTGTTHPAMVELFENLFSGYGCVYSYPRYKQDTGTYAWNIQVILHKTFEFLLETREKCRKWVATRAGTMLAYLAGLIDAEGNIRLYGNPITIGIIVSIWNTDTDLLKFAHKCLAQLGCGPLEPYLSNPPGGESSGFHIKKNKAEWRVLVARFAEAQSLLRMLPLRHKEKVAKKEILLSVARGDLYDTIADKVSSLRKAIKEEVKGYTNQAELEYLQTHPGKNWDIPQDVKDATNRDGPSAGASMQESSGTSDAGAGIVGGEDSN